MGGGAILIAYDVVVAAVVLVLLVDLLWGRWTESVVADLVVSLGEHGGLRTLRDQLARALGDPSLIVGYWVVDQERYVDDFGRPIDLPRARRASRSHRSMMAGNGSPCSCRIRLRSTIHVSWRRWRQPTRLAVVNARLQADARARLIDLNASLSSGRRVG